MKKLSSKWIPCLLTVEQKACNNVKLCASVEKIQVVNFEFLPHPSCSPDVAVGNYDYVRNLLQGKRFGSIDEVVTKAGQNFKDFGKLFYRNTNMLEK